MSIRDVSLRALFISATLAMFGLSCSKDPNTNSSRRTEGTPLIVTDDSASTVLEGFGTIDQFDTQSEAEAALAFHMPTPGSSFARVGRVTVRNRDSQAPIGESKYLDADHHVITLVVRRGDTQSTSKDHEHRTIGGIDAVVGGDPWNLQFLIHSASGDVLCVVYGVPEIQESVMADFIRGLHFN